MKKKLSKEEYDEWMKAAVEDPSILAPYEMGYDEDGNYRFPDQEEINGNIPH